MSLLIFIIVVLVLLALVLYAIRLAPLEQPISWIIQALAVVVAIVLIGQRAGVF